MNGMFALALLFGAFLSSALGCEAIKVFAVHRALFDIPNERSLHAAPVPRLGGVALVGTAWLFGVAAYLRYGGRELGIFLILSIPVFVIGLIDDLRPVPARLRMIAQIVVSSLFWAVVGAPTQFTICQGVVFAVPALLAYPLLVLWTVGVVNITNFMDGMDGLAAVQTMTAALGVAVVFGESAVAISLFMLVLFAASLGFFVHNAPKARIFLGDAGSTVIGFAFATITMLPRGPQPSLLLLGPYLLAPFLLDATFTLIRRARRGERVWEAHRSHLYQRAVATGLTHADVLRRYALWMVLSGVFGVLVSAVHVSGLIASTASLLLCLMLVWRWVTARERMQDTRKKVG